MTNQSVLPHPPGVSVKKFVFLLMPLTALAFLGLLALYRMAKLALPAPKLAAQTPLTGSDVSWM